MKSHQNKHIREAVNYAIERGWRLTESTGHVWGQLLCPLQTREGCVIRVFGTPKNPENHAKWIRRNVEKCPHMPAIPADEPEDSTDVA